MKISSLRVHINLNVELSNCKNLKTCTEKDSFLYRRVKIDLGVQETLYLSKGG